MDAKVITAATDALPIVPASLIRISSTNVTIPVEAIVIAEVEDVTPIVAASFKIKSSTKVTIPVDAIVIADADDATPIVPPSLIRISSTNVTIPVEAICIAAVEDAEPILPLSGTITPPSAESVIVVAEIAPLNIALPASLISSVSAVISEASSVPLKIISASPA